MEQCSFPSSYLSLKWAGSTVEVNKLKIMMENKIEFNGNGVKLVLVLKYQKNLIIWKKWQVLVACLA